MVENGGNISQAMRDAGYSPATAKTPQKLTKSKSWQKLMKKYLHDEYLISKHIQLLDATVSDKLVFEDDVPDEVLEKMIKLVSYSGTAYIVGRTGAKTFLYYSAPDRRAQLAALALAYKIKGKLNPNVSVSGEKVIAILGGAITNSLQTNSNQESS